jgi:hypothetical protein
MTVGPKSPPAFAAEAPIVGTGKEVVLTGSASGSDIDVQKSGKVSRDRTTFATHGLRQDNYRPIDTYEGLHRYDPDFEWKPEEEKKLVRKVRACQRTGAQEPC